MNPELFRGSKSGSVTHVGTGDAAYWAYIPNPLPPALSLDSRLVNALSRADRAVGELSGLGRNLPNPHLLIGPFVRREAVLSSRIEGTQAGLDDLYAYESGERASASGSADVQEVSNYVEAMTYGLARLETLPVSLRLLREVHAILMQGARGGHATPGEFRTSQNWIGRPGSSLREADFVPPPVPAMQQALSDLEAYLHAEDSYPPLVRLAFIHSRFETIHPFLDGNGRVGRLMVSFLMVAWRLLPLPLLYLSAFFNEHRQEYYTQLRGVSERDSWASWVLFFLNGVEEQSADAVSRARQLQDLLASWRQQLQQTRSPVWMVALVDCLFEVPTLSARAVGERFHVSLPTALDALRRLEALGILRERTGRERRQSYIADAIVRIVS
jgi:Fic family protein